MDPCLRDRCAITVSPVGADLKSFELVAIRFLAPPAAAEALFLFSFAP